MVASHTGTRIALCIGFLRELSHAVKPGRSHSLLVDPIERSVLQIWEECQVT